MFGLLFTAASLVLAILGLTTAYGTHIKSGLSHPSEMPGVQVWARPAERRVLAGTPTPSPTPVIPTAAYWAVTATLSVLDLIVKDSSGSKTFETMSKDENDLFEADVLPAVSKGFTAGLKASGVDVVVHWVSYGYSWDTEVPSGPRRLGADRQSRRTSNDDPEFVWRPGVKGLHVQLELYPTQAFLLSQAGNNPGLTIRAAAALWVARVRLLLLGSSEVGNAIAADLSESTGLNVQTSKLSWPPDGTPRAVLLTPSRTVREDITTTCPSTVQAAGFVSLCIWNSNGVAEPSASPTPSPSQTPTPSPSASPPAPVDINAPQSPGGDAGGVSAVVQTPLGAGLAAALATIAAGLIVGIILIVRGGCRNSAPSSLPAHGGVLAPHHDGTDAAIGRDGLPPGVSIADVPVALPVMVYQDGQLVSYDRARHSREAPALSSSQLASQHGVSHQHPARLQHNGSDGAGGDVGVVMADIDQSRRLALASHSAEIAASGAHHHHQSSYAPDPRGTGRFAFEPQTADQSMAMTSHGFMAGHLWPQQPTGIDGRWPHGVDPSVRASHAGNGGTAVASSAANVHTFMRQARGSIALDDQDPGPEVGSGIGVFSVTGPNAESRQYRATGSTAVDTPKKRHPGSSLRQMPQMGSYMSDDAGDDSFTSDAEELNGIMGIDTPTGDPVAPTPHMHEQGGRTLAARRGVDHMTVATAVARGSSGGGGHGSSGRRGASYDEMNLASMASTGEDASPGPTGWSAAAAVRATRSRHQPGERLGIAHSGASASRARGSALHSESRPRQETVDRGTVASLSIEIDGEEEEEEMVTASRDGIHTDDSPTSTHHEQQQQQQPAAAASAAVSSSSEHYHHDAASRSRPPLRAAPNQWPPQTRAGTASSGMSDGSALSTVRAAAGVDTRTASSTSSRRGVGSRGPQLGVWARRGCTTAARSSSVARPVVAPGVPSPHGNRSAAQPSRGQSSTARADDRQFNSMASLSDDDGASIM